MMVASKMADSVNLVELLADNGGDVKGVRVMLGQRPALRGEQGAGRWQFAMAGYFVAKWHLTVPRAVEGFPCAAVCSKT
jgi:hypothetical protein